MSLSSIQSALSTSSHIRPQSEKAAHLAKENANNVFSSKPLQPDTFELSSVAQQKIETSRTLVGGATPAQPGAQEPQSGDVFTRADVTELFTQWGDVKPGAKFDFNNDGRVDASDLATLLSKIGQPKPESKPAEDQPFTQADIERLTDAWNDGSDSSRAVNTRYDLDGDGRVNSSDLAELLSRLSSS